MKSFLKIALSLSDRSRTLSKTEFSTEKLLFIEKESFETSVNCNCFKFLRADTFLFYYRASADQKVNKFNYNFPQSLICVMK